jgi:hypothetical protein
MLGFLKILIIFCCFSIFDFLGFFQTNNAHLKMSLNILINKLTIDNNAFFSRYSTINNSWIRKKSNFGTFWKNVLPNFRKSKKVLG